MRTLFFGLLNFFLISCIIIVLCAPRYYDVSSFKGYTIIDQNRNYFITSPVKPRPSGRGYKGLKNVTF